MDYSKIRKIHNFDLGNPRREISQETAKQYLEEGRQVIFLVRDLTDLNRPELRYDDINKGWFILCPGANVSEVPAQFLAYHVTFFEAVMDIRTTGRPTYEYYHQPKSLQQRWSEFWYQLKHFNEGLYPPGQIPTRRTFHVTNLEVVRTMFDRAGLAYENLRRVQGSKFFQVEISRDVAPHNPEYLAFVDRNRFWSFTINGFARDGYWTVSFQVHAYTRVEALQINLRGQVPKAVDIAWDLVPQ